jgi:hypothetical protein
MLGEGKWDAEYPRWPALHQVQETLGSWNAAIVAAGFDPRQRGWSAAAIIQAAQRWTEHHGQAPRIENWRRSATDGSHPSSRPPLDTFGGWNAMLRAAGLPVTHRAWSREEILSALSDWMTTHQRAPAMADWMHPEPAGAYPTPGCAADCFGSWNAMLTAGGVAPKRRSWSREEILLACAEFEDRHGRALRAEDLRGANDLPSIGAVRRHLGNHRALLDAVAAWRSLS